ncbi:unnamed protein product, partial [marine sediment metagenome]
YNEGLHDGLEKTKDKSNELDFVGGNEQKSKENKEDKEKEYECPCGAEFDGEAKFCPECGEELDWDDETEHEEGWLSGLMKWNNSNDYANGY